MKKLLHFLFFILVASASNAQSQLADAVNKLFKNEFYQVYSGTLNARQTNASALVVSVSTTSSSVFDKVLLLTSATPMAFGNFISEKACVMIHASKRFAILIDESSQKIYLLGLDEDETLRQGERLKADLVTGKALQANEFLAYGLSVITGGWRKDDLQKSELLDPFNYLAAADITGMNGISADAEQAAKTGAEKLCIQGGCTSGGAGASDCDITEDYVGVHQSCKVTCKTGYYACCASKTTRCYCCREAQ